MFMQPFPQVFFKSILLAATWQKDIGKKGHEMANLSTLVCLFYGIPVFLSLHHNCFPSRKRKQWDLDLSSLSEMPFLTVFSVRSNYTWICSSASYRLGGAWAVSQCSSKWDQGNSADLHPQRICLMRFAMRHVISLLESPLADTKFPLRSQPKLLKILQTSSKSPWNRLRAKKGQLLCLSSVTCVPPSAHCVPPSACCLPPSPHQLSPALLQDDPCGARSCLTTPSQTEPADKAHVLGFLLIHHTKSCSYVAGAQTQEVWAGV